MTTITRPLSLTLSIPAEPAYSFNPNGGRKHWAVRHQETQAAHWAVRAALGDVHRFFPGPVRLAWTIYLAKGRRRLDVDNCLACLKPFTDALVKGEVIGSDSPRFIPDTPTVEQITWSQHKSEPRIEVRIEEIWP